MVQGRKLYPDIRTVLPRVIWNSPPTVATLLQQGKISCVSSTVANSSSLGKTGIVFGGAVNTVGSITAAQNPLHPMSKCIKDRVATPTNIYLGPLPAVDYAPAPRAHALHSKSSW
jgi:hypothetical protein